MAEKKAKTPEPETKEVLKEVKAKEIVETKETVDALVVDAPIVADDAAVEVISETDLKKVDSLVEGIPVEGVEPLSETKSSWKPKTSLGKKVVSGEITDIGEILDKGEKILESEIVDALLPGLQNDLLLIGQAKGKFGGGQRRVFKTTQKKSMEGNKPKFAALAVVGNCDGFVGVGYGKSKETVPAREKALRQARLHIMKIKRGCGSWKCNCGEPHSIPFQVQGKCGSTEIILIPAPKGTGLKVEKECAKILKLAGVRDAWSWTNGQTRTKINLVHAFEEALQNLNETKLKSQHIEQLGIVDGRLSKEQSAQLFMESMKVEPEKKDYNSKYGKKNARRSANDRRYSKEGKHG